jgi:hypothetical protein
MESVRYPSKPKEAQNASFGSRDFSPRNKAVTEGSHLTAVGQSAGKAEATLSQTNPIKTKTRFCDEPFKPRNLRQAS